MHVVALLCYNKNKANSKALLAKVNFTNKICFFSQKILTTLKKYNKIKPELCSK